MRNKMGRKPNLDIEDDKTYFQHKLEEAIEHKDFNNIRKYKNILKSLDESLLIYKLTKKAETKI